MRRWCEAPHLHAVLNLVLDHMVEDLEVNSGSKIVCIGEEDELFALQNQIDESTQNGAPAHVICIIDD
jgi:hypothetical protein